MKEVLLQKVVFPQENICSREDLYYKKGAPTIRGFLQDGVVFPFGQSVSFETYFNSLSVSKWSKYTYADTNYALKLTLRGKFEIKLLHTYFESYDSKTQKGRVCREIVSTHVLNLPDKQTVRLNYTTQSLEGCLSFSVKAEPNSCFYSGGYVADIEDSLNDVRLGIGICTFKREQYVQGNLSNICRHIFDNADSPLNNRLEIFVSDNASTLPQEVASNSHIHLVQNKNTGGSGGFTRCMIEAISFNDAAENKITNLVLMDDDIKFDIASLERLYTLLSLLKEKYRDAFVGGAMFEMARPNMQHASGEYFHGERCENFIETYNKDLDMSKTESILQNEIITDANYQAWWFCAMPMNVIRPDSLSMPFFIKSDDIEFSLRNLKTLILLNGINVWHESFEMKYSAPNEYYTIRNYLVTAAAHDVHLTQEDILLLMRHYYRHYACNYKYYEIEHMCHAINDFLRGVDYFKGLDIAEVHKKIMPKGYKMVDAEQLPVKVSKSDYERDTSKEITWNKTRWKVALYTINGLFLSPKGYSVLGMWGGNYAQTYRKEFLVRYEPHSQKGFVLYRSKKRFFAVSRLYRKTKRKVKRKFDKAYAEFRARWRELCTLENWQQHLDLN